MIRPPSFTVLDNYVDTWYSRDGLGLLYKIGTFARAVAVTDPQSLRNLIREMGLGWRIHARPPA